MAGLVSFMHPKNSFTLDRYRIEPTIHVVVDGGFTAGVSIRSGSGHATHDRVFRFTPLFSSRESARRYAAREAVNWVRHRVQERTTH